MCIKRSERASHGWRIVLALATLNILALVWATLGPKAAVQTVRALSGISLPGFAQAIERFGSHSAVLVGYLDATDRWGISEFAELSTEYRASVASIAVSVTPIPALSHLPCVIAPLEDAVEQLGTNKMATSGWVLFDHGGKRRASGEMAGGAARGSIEALLFGAETDLPHATLTAFSSSTIAGSFANSAGAPESSPGAILLFVDVFSVDCGVAYAIVEVNRRFGTNGRIGAILVPSSWSESDVIALASNWGLVIPIVRLSDAADVAWSDLRRRFGRSAQVGFALEYRSGRLTWLGIDALRGH